MALVLKDRVLETCTSPGTGTITLLGAVTGYQAFSTVGNGNTCYYAIADQNGANWEVGIGTYSSGTLARTTVLSSSNAGSLTNFSTGTQNVFLTYPSSRSVNLSSAALTSGRVTYATTDGLLTDSANLVFTGTNLGLGTTPSPFPAGRTVLEIGGSTTGNIAFNGNATNGYQIWCNSYFNAGSSFYYANGLATNFGSGGGAFFWNLAPNNTSGAGAVATFTQAMTLDANGSLALGGTTTASSNGGMTINCTSSGSSSVPLVLRNAGTANGSGVVLSYRGVTNTSAENDYAYLSMVADNTTALTGSIRFSTANGAGAPAERMRITSAGNVGIGTTTPAAKLEVSGATDTIKTLGTSYNQQIYDCSAGFSQAVWQYIGVSKALINASASGMLINTASDATAPMIFATGSGATERMRITSAGSVGIGTSSPQYVLHANSANNTTSLFLTPNSGSTAADYTQLGFGNSAGNSQIYGGIRVAFANPAATTAVSMQFFTDSGSSNYVERMRIASNGYVGINTNVPASALEVGGVGKFWTGVTGGLGTVALGDNATTSYNVGIFRGAANSISTAGNYLNAGGYDGIVFTTGATALGSQTARMIITQAGNVGINTGAADSYAKLFVNGVVTSSYGATSALFSDAITCSLYITHTSGVTGIISDSTLKFGSGSLGTERMRITSTGDVGIGTSSPSYKLDVNGDALINGNLNVASNIRTFISPSTLALSANQYTDIMYIGAGGYGAPISGILTVYSTYSGAITQNSYFCNAFGNGNAGTGISLLSNGTYSTPSNFILYDRGPVLGGGSRVISVYNASGNTVGITFTFAPVGLGNSAGYYTSLTNTGSAGAGTGLPSGVTVVFGQADAQVKASGITFPAAQAASSDVNTLDDYEEGAWTPTLASNGGGETVTYNYRSGVYRKIGSMVYVQFGMNIASTSGGSGGAYLSGLPFTSVSRGPYQEPAVQTTGGNWVTAAYAGQTAVFVGDSSTTFGMRYLNNADTDLPFSQFQSGTYMSCVMVYCSAN